MQREEFSRGRAKLTIEKKGFTQRRKVVKQDAKFSLCVLFYRFASWREILFTPHYELVAQKTIEERVLDFSGYVPAFAEIAFFLEAEAFESAD